MLCLEPLQFSILDWLCGGQASCAGQTSEAAHRGLHSNYYSGHSCSEQVASLPALVAPKPPPRPQACPASCRASNYTEPHNRWCSFYGHTGNVTCCFGKSLPLAGFS